MRDLQGIAEINGPNWRDLQWQRLATIDRARFHKVFVNKGCASAEHLTELQRAEHGRRVEERQAVNR